MSNAIMCISGDSYRLCKKLNLERKHLNLTPFCNFKVTYISLLSNTVNLSAPAVSSMKSQYYPFVRLLVRLTDKHQLLNTIINSIVILTIRVNKKKHFYYISHQRYKFTSSSYLDIYVFILPFAYFSFRGSHCSSATIHKL